MESVHVIRLEIAITPRLTRGALAGLLLLAWAPELGSENVTLTTYYPAPSGIYARVITTGNTYLARDSPGVVSIGTTAPAAGHILTVNGSIHSLRHVIGTDNNAYVSTGAYAIGGSALGVYTNSAERMTVTNAGDVGIGITDPGSNITSPGVDRVSAGTGKILEVNGAIRSMYGSNLGSPPCAVIGVSAGGVTDCPAGNYATQMVGFYATWIGMGKPQTPGETHTMFCCPCADLPNSDCP